tara:strand:+ start:2451 stop:2660 length:210 start_codon:yes stop_codon:yes gene_type:complete
MNPVILIACFSPIAVIWIIVKLSLWIAAVNDEQNYVRAEFKKPHGPYVENPYADVDEEEEEFTSRTDYR